MDRSVGFDVRRNWFAPRQFVVLACAALLPLVITGAVGSHSATSIAAMALVLGLLIAVGGAVGLVGLVAGTNRAMIAHRRRDGVAVESNDPPLHPVRPRAPGLA